MTGDHVLGDRLLGPGRADHPPYRPPPQPAEVGQLRPRVVLGPPPGIRRSVKRCRLLSSHPSRVGSLPNNPKSFSAFLARRRYAADPAPKAPNDVRGPLLLKQQ